MKLIILYGAPAVGKLTIARAVAADADFEVFDNHKVIDIVEPIVSRDFSGFRDLVYRAHIDVLAAAAESDSKNVITTFPYAANEPDDVAFLKTVVEKCSRVGAKVYVVHLIATDDDLLRRVTDESRNAYGKIGDKDLMARIIRLYDFTTPADHTDLVIDTSTTSSERSARLIIDSMQ